MVSLKEATQNAVAFAREALGPERTAGVRLEEVESTTVEGAEAWLITLSMIAPEEGTDVVAISKAHRNALAGTAKREYKSFTVLKDNGEVKSMKIRELADV
jgi:hypothetical protein